MADYPLILIDGCYYAQGHVCELVDPDEPRDRSTILLVFYKEGDCDTIHEVGEPMHRALYDLYQTSDQLNDGDTFSIDGKVLYQCSGVHVVEFKPG